jgi:DNA-binding transcriptional MerR regulator
MMERLTLIDLEKLTGIKAATIRVWERRYRIIRPNRTTTNRRWYDNDDVTTLINISILYRKGIKISKIALLSAAELKEKAAALANESFDAAIEIDSLATAMIGFNENAVNEILLRSIINSGFEETFTGVIFPFLRRVGTMWHTGKANIGAEHFISNIFRRKLIAAIDTLTPPVIPGRKRFIMYLPEEEFHDIGLLFYTYIIRRMGHDIMYLGQSTPFDTLSEVNDQWHADYFVTSLQSGLPYIKPEDYLESLSEKFSKQKILVAGLLAEVAERNKNSNVNILRSVSDLKFIK